MTSEVKDDETIYQRDGSGAGQLMEHVQPQVIQEEIKESSGEETKESDNETNSQARNMAQ